MATGGGEMKSGSGPLRAPFPWFGGKRRCAPLVWERFGRVRNYVEPFFGSGAVLFGRPLPFEGIETVNDADGFVANFWRAVQGDPGATAAHADNPVNENDLHARHAWLVGQRDTLTARLEGDPDWFDPKVAGWWAWGVSCWIGSGFCSGKGPWNVVEAEDGARKLVHLGDAGRGVNRKRDGHSESLLAYFEALAARLRHVRVCCGDWTRVMGPTPMQERGSAFHPIGVLLDPPYADEADRTPDLYRVDCGKVAHDVRKWALAHGDDPRYRIALCGYEGEHAMPESWECIAGLAGGGHGYGGQDREGYANEGRERIWFSPHCVTPDRLRTPLFDALEAS